MIVKLTESGKSADRVERGMEAAWCKIIQQKHLQRKTVFDIELGFASEFRNAIFPQKLLDSRYHHFPWFL